MTTCFILISSLTFALLNDSTPVQYKKVEEVDFTEGLDIEGQTLKPDGALVQQRGKAKFNPLIKLRVDFSEEMQTSVSEIK